MQCLKKGSNSSFKKIIIFFRLHSEQGSEGLCIHRRTRKDLVIYLNILATYVIALMKDTSAYILHFRLYYDVNCKLNLI